MPPTTKDEMILYRLNHIDENIGKLFILIEGNGADGIKGRLTRVESTVVVQESRWKWIFGIVAAVVAVTIMTVIKSFI